MGSQLESSCFRLPTRIVVPMLVLLVGLGVYNIISTSTFGYRSSSLKSKSLQVQSSSDDEATLIHEAPSEIPVVDAPSEIPVVDAEAVAQKWGLLSQDAVGLLKKVADQKTVEYDPDRDFLVFYHPMKTGGTSVSDLLQSMVGGVVPGSHRSGHFSYELFNTTRHQETANLTLEEWWRTKKVVFSHNAFQMGPNETRFASMLRSSLPRGHTRRFRLMTMVREPLALRASHYSMSLCHISRLISLEARRLGLPRSTKDPCHGMNLTYLADVRLQYEFKPKCQSGKMLTNGMTNKCTAFFEHGIDPYPHCRSISRLLNSTAYDMYLHDIERDIIKTTNGSVSDIENDAIERLGDLEEGVDFIWFGITERLQESICLLNYRLGLDFMPTPRERVMPCRPTSWWSESDAAIVRDREVLGHAVHRAANAVLDIQLAKMRHEIQAKLAQNVTLESVSDTCLAAILSSFTNVPRLDFSVFPRGWKV